MTDFDWQDAVSRLVKGELARAGVTMTQLAQRLCALGGSETEQSVRNKLWRGTYSATFLVQCLTALGITRLDFESLLPAEMPRGDALDGRSDDPQSSVA